MSATKAPTKKTFDRRLYLNVFCMPPRGRFQWGFVNIDTVGPVLWSEAKRRIPAGNWRVLPCVGWDM